MVYAVQNLIEERRGSLGQRTARGKGGGHVEAINLFVKANPMLKDTVEKLVSERAIRFDRVELNANEYLFREGDDIRRTFYVQKGLIKLSSDTADGYTKTVFLHKAGTLLGFQGLQELEDRKPSILNAKASMMSSVIALDAADFGAFLEAHGDICYEMTRYLFSMLALQTRESVNSSVYNVLQRFAALLLKLAQELGGTSEPALIPFSNAELGEMLGVHVNSINNAIDSLRKSGCIDKQRSYLAIIDFKKLTAVADTLA